MLRSNVFKAIFAGLRRFATGPQRSWRFPELSAKVLDFPVSPNGSKEAIVLDGVSRTFITPSGPVPALKPITLLVRRGEMVALNGPSGSGKTTLLHLVAGLDRATSGVVGVLGVELNRCSDRQLTEFRGNKLGLILQDAQLIPGLTAIENVVLARLPWGPRRKLEAQVRDLLVAVGLEARVDFRPAYMSAGERLRVRLARALLGNPGLLVADEPTGKLDVQATEDLMALLDDLRHDLALTILIVTHDPAVSAAADRRLRLIDGSLEAEPRRAAGGALRARRLE